MKAHGSRVVGGLLVLLLVAAAGAAAPALAATQGTSTLQVSMSKFAQLNVVTNTLTLTPEDADMAQGFLEESDAVEVKVRTNSIAGATLKVYGSAGNPGIALADLLIKSGAPGSAVTDWAAIAGNADAAQTIWSVSARQPSWTSVYLSLKIQNLWEYAEGTYSNTLTFMVSTN